MSQASYGTDRPNATLACGQMADAFDEMKQKAALEYRLGFARRVLRTELVAARLLGSAIVGRKFRVGQLDPGSTPPTWYFTYTEHGRNVEGKKVTEGEGLFADLSDDSEDDYLEELDDHGPNGPKMARSSSSAKAGCRRRSSGYARPVSR